MFRVKEEVEERREGRECSVYSGCIIGGALLVARNEEKDVYRGSVS